MSNIMAVVEGVTEQTFIRDVLSPWLWEQSQIVIVASTAGKPGKKGGNSFGKVKRDIIKHLKNPHFTTVTTFFDFYGMSDKWPGKEEALKKPHSRKPHTVEKAIFEAIKEVVNPDIIRKFRPYIQIHEFEALLFSDTSILPEVMRQPDTKTQLDQIRAKFKTPEEINDSAMTAPSKRIMEIYEFYQKPFHGLLASKGISVETMRSECPHFNEWIEDLCTKLKG